MRELEGPAVGIERGFYGYQGEEGRYFCIENKKQTVFSFRIIGKELQQVR